MQKIAWHAANTMNVHLKKKVTMKQLLGQEKTTSREQRVAQFEELKKRLERQKAE